MIVDWDLLSQLWGPKAVLFESFSFASLIFDSPLMVGRGSPVRESLLCVCVLARVQDTTLTYKHTHKL